MCDKLLDIKAIYYSNVIQTTNETNTKRRRFTKRSITIEHTLQYQTIAYITFGVLLHLPYIKVGEQEQDRE